MSLYFQMLNRPDLKDKTYNSLSPFYSYLKTAEEVARKKAGIVAAWEKCDEISLQWQLAERSFFYRLDSSTTIVLENRENTYLVVPEKNEEIDRREPIEYRFEGQKYSFEVQNMRPAPTANSYFIALDAPLELQRMQRINWDGVAVHIIPAFVAEPKAQKYAEINKKAVKISFVSQENGRLTIQTEERLPVEFSYVQFGEQQLPLAEAVSSSSKTLAAAKAIATNDGETIYMTSSPQAGLKAIELGELINLITTPLDICRLVGVGEIAQEKDNIFRYIGDRTKLEAICQKKYAIRAGAATGIEFRLHNQGSKNGHWIQLKEVEGGEEDADFATISPLHTFFEDDIAVKDDKGNTYSIDRGIESEFKLLLRNRETKKIELPQGERLNVEINTHQIRTQLRAIAAMQNMPLRWSMPLLQLFEKEEEQPFEPFWPDAIAEEDWQVLKDGSRSGSSQQRDFVEKALATPDFAILEGPPGSGKTTVILEIICQLAKQGKRVLLCGSTHVAVDNVLEKLTAKAEGGQTLLEKFDVFPLRIGDENRISESIKKWQINNFVRDNNITEDLAIDAANLICGTTLGILQYPRIKDAKNKSQNFPVYPEFDYLIIDESSKTTFQEFLVPALYAKKWLLIGDVRQLAPFSDREQLVSSIKHLPLIYENKNKDYKAKTETLPDEIQQAVFYAFKLEEIYKQAQQADHPKLALQLSQKAAYQLEKELAARDKNQEPKYIYGFLHLPLAEPQNPLTWLQCDVLFIGGDDVQNQLPKYLPAAFIPINAKDNRLQFRFNAVQKNLAYTLKPARYKDIFDADEIQNYLQREFSTKDWATEIAWRIDRDFQLRQKREKNKHYNQGLKPLLPQAAQGYKAEDIDRRIRTVASVALPSILESLIKGVAHRHLDNILGQGLPTEIKDSRYTILEYQHRMHSDISAFPRQIIYNNQALQDLANPISIDDLRQWSFSRYPSRSLWYDLPNAKAMQSSNKAEVEAIKRELKAFLDFAAHNPPPKGEPHWTVACLTFYRAQERLLRDMLRQLCQQPTMHSHFSSPQASIKLHTVDKFQGHEADIVFLSMVQTYRVGFLDNPNRLNVAVTRAKFQLVIFGKHEYFANLSKDNSEELQKLAQRTPIFKPNERGNHY